MDRKLLAFTLFSAVHALFWLWVYLRLETSSLARMVWEKTWVRWTAWQSPRWVLVFSIVMMLFTALLVCALLFPEGE